MATQTSGPGGPGIPEISPAELKERMERGDDVLLVDVREDFERHIADLPDEGQRRIPVGEFEARMGELDRDREIVVYCRSGSRSGWAVERLMEAGYERALNLAGGLLGWREDVDPELTAY